MADEFSVLSREYLARKDDSAAIPVKINSSGIGPAHYDVCSMSTCTYVTNYRLLFRCFTFFVLLFLAQLFRQSPSLGIFEADSGCIFHAQTT